MLLLIEYIVVLLETEYGSSDYSVLKPMNFLTGTLRSVPAESSTSH